MCIRDSLKARADAGLSVGGFIGHLTGSSGDLDVTDHARAQVQQWQAVQELPRLHWEQFAGPDGRLDKAGAAALVAATQREPNKVWFRLAEEAGAASTHPTTRRRVLCLLGAACAKRHGARNPSPSRRWRFEKCVGHHAAAPYP